MCTEDLRESIKPLSKLIGEFSKVIGNEVFMKKATAFPHALIKQFRN